MCMFVSQLEELTLIPFHVLWINTEQFFVMPQIPASGLFQWTQIPSYFSWGRLSWTQTKAYPITRTAAVDSEFRILSGLHCQVHHSGQYLCPIAMVQKRPWVPKQQIHIVHDPTTSSSCFKTPEKAFSWSAYNLWTEWLVGKWLCLQRLEEVPVTSNS